jgi:hypothetical protein
MMSRTSALSSWVTLFVSITCVTDYFAALTAGMHRTLFLCQRGRLLGRKRSNRFGEGKILEISGQVPDLKAKVSFDQYGDKLLLLKFAKLRHK